MQYALFPFPSLREAGGADIREQLRIRASTFSPRRARIGNLELLDNVVELLRDLPWSFIVDHCHEANGDLRLAVFANDLGRDLEKGDTIAAGFYLANSESCRFDTVACERLHRVACTNGMLVECEQQQVMVISADEEAPDWRTKLRPVLARSFCAEGIDLDIARFRATTEQMLMTPYEMLCNLVAQGFLSDDEQSDVQREFDAAADYTLYGLINAVTRIAHRLRDFDDWQRAFEVERLGGEILRGDHTPPVLDPIYS